MFVARILISLSPYGLKSLEMINTEVIYKKNNNIILPK